MDASTRFAQSVLLSMRRDVEEAGGNEVFWVGRIGADGLVAEAEVGARGNEDSVVVNRSAAREGHVLVHNHPGGNLSPSRADQSVAAHSSDSSLGFYIVDNAVSEVYVVVEPVRPRELVPLDEDAVAGLLAEGGALSRLSPGFEERPGQIALLREIARAFNGGRVGVFEAGTGTGKSYAYLIPAMLWALQNKERVVISTGTINLQQQLVEKDIPAAQRIIGREVKAVLLKGRQNYVCLRRLAEAGNERELFDADTDTLDRIAAWAKTSPTGSRSDLSFMPDESVWGRVNSESDACMGMRCPFREDCFVMRVRKDAADASIVVVNHHLLFADIESRMGGAGYDDTAVLPPYRRIVFDEAHGIEDSATSFFSETITRFKLAKQLNLLYRAYRGSVAGFLVQVSAVATAEDFLHRAGAAVQDVRAALLGLDEIGLSVLGDDQAARIHAGSAERFEAVFPAMDALRAALASFTGMVREVLETVSEEDRDIPSVWETKSVLRRLEDMIVLCRSFCEWNEHDDRVFYLQKVRLPPKRQGDAPVHFVQFTQTPLDVAPLMDEGVFEPMSCVVCTSATLRTGTSFSYWMRRTGISFVEEERLSQGVFESPFPYRTNAIFAVPRDAPMPDSGFAFQDYVEETVPRLILAAGGRTLVLFTSYDSLRHCYASARAALAAEGMTLLRQGDDDRFRLLDRFREDTSSVLFATDSFWEGVDVPGESLSQVIIVKLPFSVPTDPVFAARSEAVERRGGSSFMELSVPQAVIKFRQGFGRLMRRSDDKGVIVVLDRRIVEKAYGRQFTTSVPMTRRMYNPLEDILRAVRRFFSASPES